MPLLLAAKKQAPETQLDDDARRGLAGMSISTAIQESFYRIMFPERDRILALQRAATPKPAAAAPPTPGG